MCDFVQFCSRIVVFGFILAPGPAHLQELQRGEGDVVAHVNERARRSPRARPAAPAHVLQLRELMHVHKLEVGVLRLLKQALTDTVVHHQALYAQPRRVVLQ